MDTDVSQRKVINGGGCSCHDFCERIDAYSIYRTYHNDCFFLQERLILITKRNNRLTTTYAAISKFALMGTTVIGFPLFSYYTAIPFACQYFFENSAGCALQCAFLVCFYLSEIVFII